MRRLLPQLGYTAACAVSLFAISTARAEDTARPVEEVEGRVSAAASEATESVTPAAAEPTTSEVPAAADPSPIMTPEAAGLKRARLVVQQVDEILERMKAADSVQLPHEIVVGRSQLTALQEEAKSLEQFEKLQGVSRMPLVGLIIAYAYECNNLAAVKEMSTAYERERESLIGGWGGPDPSLPRKWRSVNGTVAEGVLISHDREFVLVRRTNGKLAKAPRASLSKEDNAFLDALPETTPVEAATADQPAPAESPDDQQTNPVAIRIQKLERSRVD